MVSVNQISFISFLTDQHKNTSAPNHNLTFAFLNARSLRNKANDIVNYAIDNSLDVAALSET